MLKVLLFAWKCCRSALPTESSLHQRVLKVDGLCALCGNGEEGSEHMLSVCPFARLVWVVGHWRWSPDQGMDAPGAQKAGEREKFSAFSHESALGNRNRCTFEGGAAMLKPLSTRLCAHSTLVIIQVDHGWMRLFSRFCLVGKWYNL